MRRAVSDLMNRSYRFPIIYIPLRQTYKRFHTITVSGECVDRVIPLVIGYTFCALKSVQGLVYPFHIEKKKKKRVGSGPSVGGLDS